MNFRNKIILILILSILAFFNAKAQYVPGKERGDSGKRAKAQMEGNRIRTTIHNFGFTGRTGGEFPIYVQTPYEWPKNTGHVYLALTAIFIGGEVVDNTGTTIKIVDTPTYRSSPEGSSWNLEPVPGYYNDERAERSIATSNDVTTWPATWPDRMNDDVDPGWAGSWNGLGGKNDFRADQEIFYRASDDLYSRYTTYFPDSTDLTRKGMGILLDVRVLAWSQYLVQDAIYILHSIKNDGTKDIPKTAVTMWHADFVGGDGDSQDDISYFDLLNDIGFSRDKDNRSANFGSDPVGIVGQAFLETPGNSSDRIDNDGDGEENGPKVTAEMLVGEIPDDLVDNNGNGLIDENEAHIAFQDQVGVTYANGIDENGNAEEGSPVITNEMVSLVAGDKWQRWPANPETDPIQNGKVHLIGVNSDFVGYAYKDNIDDNGNGEDKSPTVTQEMIDKAASDDPYYRYAVNNKIILYDVHQDDLGKKYADGKDNDNNGAVDEFMDEGIDEMIDESRSNGIDDDGDWNSITDDVGMDGIPNTGDQGENDGKPTSGAKSGLPGEPNVDVTDVSETDQIGITNAQYDPAGSWDFNSVADNTIWFRLMRPGNFYDPQNVVAGEYDLFISSGYFPLAPGQTEPISVSVILANGPSTDPDGLIRRQEILKKKIRVQETYENDYQFANAPLTPTLTAVPGNNRVTLYWDRVAETSFDKYINNVGGDGYDFEGYKIYRSTDPAFQDIETITTGAGTPAFRTPLVIFDKEDNYSGYDSVGIDGVKYYLGSNSGLQHTFVDSSVQNGFTYYYAIVSYDFGYPQGEIIPTECDIKLTLKSDGSVDLGQNVARIIPQANAGGYKDPTIADISLAEGYTSGTVDFQVYDVTKVKDNHVYNITFEDTVIAAKTDKDYDKVTTKNFTLTDSTANTVLVSKSTDFGEQPVVDGFQIKFYNQSNVELNQSASSWNNDGIQQFVFETVVTTTDKGVPSPNNYKIEFGDIGIGKSVPMVLQRTNFPAKDVNFKITNTITNQDVKFGFAEIDRTGEDGLLTANGARKDRVVLFEDVPGEDSVMTWWLYLNGDTSGTRFPTKGDILTIKTRKPFLAWDKFRFVTKSQSVDETQAKKDLDNIKVVPNPYRASAVWEIKNPYNSGRGPRKMYFTHLPAKCTIRIFTINGELVKTLEHDKNLNDGSEEWDMLSKDNLGIAYGVYVFQVEAPGIGNKIGKFAVIK